MWRRMILFTVGGFQGPLALAQSQGSDGFWGHMGGNGMWGGGMMFVFWLMVLVLVVALLWWLIGSSRRGGAADAREILDRRFAKGEIDEQEYKRRRDALDS